MQVFGKLFSMAYWLSMGYGGESADILALPHLHAYEEVNSEVGELAFPRWAPFFTIDLFIL